MICKRCKEQIKTLPLKEAIKNRQWWKNEMKEIRLNDILIILAILLIFSGFYFEFAPKIKNPCDWCKIRTSYTIGSETVTCSEYIERKQDSELKLNLTYGGEIGSFKSIYP